MLSFLSAAPMDVCVLNHTVIGVSRADKETFSFVGEHFERFLLCSTCVCAGRRQADGGFVHALRVYR